MGGSFPCQRSLRIQGRSWHVEPRGEEVADGKGTDSLVNFTLLHLLLASPCPEPLHVYFSLQSLPELLNLHNLNSTHLLEKSWTLPSVFEDLSLLGRRDTPFSSVPGWTVHVPREGQHLPLCSTHPISPTQGHRSSIFSCLSCSTKFSSVLDYSH